VSTLTDLRTFTDSLPALGGNYSLQAFAWGAGTFIVKSLEVDATFTIKQTANGFRVAWKAWLPGGGNISGGASNLRTLQEVCDWIAKTVHLDGFLFE
jgi:hypothetical protein